MKLKDYIADPGDIFACYGTDLISRGISLETSTTSWVSGPSGLRWSPSHVAIASPRSFPDHRRCYWFESTAIGHRVCLEHQQTVQGVQCHEIGDRVFDYVDRGGKVEVYRLVDISQLDPVDEEFLSEMLLSYCGDGKREPRTYDTGGALLSGSRVWKWLPFGAANRDRLFCSELVSAVLQELCRQNRRNPAVYHPGGLLRSLVRQGTYRRVGSLEL